VKAPEGILEWIIRQFTPGGNIPLSPAPGAAVR
jgi:hypothetical protein